MFDWNGNGNIDDSDHVLEAYMIDKMNRESETTDDVDADGEYPDDGDGHYYYDDE